MACQHPDLLGLNPHSDIQTQIASSSQTPIYSTSSEVLVPFGVKNEHEHLQFEYIYTIVLTPQLPTQQQHNYQYSWLAPNGNYLTVHKKFFPRSRLSSRIQDTWTTARYDALSTSIRSKVCPISSSELFNKSALCHPLFHEGHHLYLTNCENIQMAIYGVSQSANLY